MEEGTKAMLGALSESQLTTLEAEAQHAKSCLFHRMDINVDALLRLIAQARAARPSPPDELPPLKHREKLKGTGDVLRDLAHAQRMSDVDEPGFGEVICRGNELRFVNRAIRVAIGEIKQLRQRLKPSPPAQDGGRP